MNTGIWAEVGDPPAEVPLLLGCRGKMHRCEGERIQQMIKATGNSAPLPPGQPARHTGGGDLLLEAHSAAQKTLKVVPRHSSLSLDTLLHKNCRGSSLLHTQNKKSSASTANSPLLLLQNCELQVNYSHLELLQLLPPLIPTSCSGGKMTSFYTCPSISPHSPNDFPHPEITKP